MLRITQSESPEAAKHYFGQSLRRGDYYLEGQEIAGAWGGKAAQRLGLKGPVGQKDFEALLMNRKPDGSPLTARTFVHRRPGYDFTFDVPKSVSLVHALGGDERILEAMRRAVAQTMQELEADMHARVRKGGAFSDRATGCMLWADFTHLTSRPAPLPRALETELVRRNPWLETQRDRDGRLNLPDPQLHMHVYAMNATFDAVEGIWKAGDFMRQKRDASYYQAAYHVRLARELQALGYEIEPTAKAFEIAGVSRGWIEVFSRRTQEVEDAARELGIVDPKAKAELGAKTRRRKNPTLGIDSLRALWRDMLPRASAQSLDVLARTARSCCVGQVLTDPQAERACLHEGLEHELTRACEVSEKRLLGTALARGIGRVSIEGVRHALASRADVTYAQVSDECRLTTAAVLAEERELMRFVRQGRGVVRPLITGAYAFTNPLFAQATEATEEQRKAVLHVLRSQDWILGVVGRAGTGKTTLLQEVRAGLERTGQALMVFAPTAEASRGVLRKEGFASADTLKRLLTDAALQAQLPGAVLWIDEAGMVGSRDLLALFKLAQEKGVKKVILSGDPTQIRSVARGEPLRFLEENAGLRVARLENIKRQKTPMLRLAVEALSRGDVAQGFSLLDRGGCLFEHADGSAHTRLACAYAKASAERSAPGRFKDVLVVSPTHAECEAVTEEIRRTLRGKGRLGTAERSFPRLVNASWTESEKSSPASYEVGMVIQFRQNAPGFVKGERVRVTDVDARAGCVRVRQNRRGEAALPLALAERFEVYRLTELALCVGDKIRITENLRAGRHRLNNGACLEVHGFTLTGGIDIGAGRILPPHVGHLAHGYAITADSAQAKTVDIAFASISRDSMPALDLRRLYVTVSRAREHAAIFTDDKAALLAAAQRETVRRSATELIGSARAEAFLDALDVLEAQRLRQARLKRPALATQAPRSPQAPKHGPALDLEM